MNTRKRSPAFGLPTRERVKLAKDGMTRAVDHICMYSPCTKRTVVAYTDTLASQIPVSHAVHAFNLFRESLLHYGLARLWAIWDDERDLAAESIQVVLNLVDDHQVMLALETCSLWAGQGAGTPSPVLTS